MSDEFVDKDSLSEKMKRGGFLKALWM